MSRENKAVNKTWDFPIKVATYNKDDHTIVFTITDASLDHDGEKVNPAGMFFRKQPKGLYSHNMNIPAVTRLEWIKYDDSNKRIVSKFAFDQNDPFSKLLEGKYAGGYMTDCSIGFIPDREFITVEESTGATIFNKWELLEVSLCNIGSNLDAMALSMAECDLMIKSYETSPDTKSTFEGLKDRLLVKSLSETVDGFKNQMKEYEHLKDIVDSFKQSSDEEVQKMVDEGIEAILETKINPKLDLLIKEVGNLKKDKKLKELEIQIEKNLNTKRNCVTVK